MIQIFHSTSRNPVLDQPAAAKNGSWIHAAAPTSEELVELSKQFSLEADLLSDATDPYESPRIERDGQAVYVFTRYCHPGKGGNATEPLLIIYHATCLITITKEDSGVFQRLIDGHELIITTQKTKTLLQMLEEVNATYHRHLNKITRQLLAARSELKRTDISNEALIGFIDLEDDLNEFLSALQPQAGMLRNLLGGRYLRLFEEDKDLIEDLVLGTAELIDLTKSRLKTIQNIRQAYDAIAATELNRVFRRLTSISIFLMIPTIVFSLYGMNVKLPFDDDPNAFWYIMGTVMVLNAAVIAIFRRKKWI